MAKTQLKNYVFKPGLGAADNLYPNAYSLLSSNKTFIQKETNAYITSRIANAAQYTPTGVDYTPTTGVLELTIGTHTFNVGDAITIAQGSLRFTCGLDGNATNHDYPRITDPAYNKALEITATTSTTITINVGISSDTSVHTFVSATANAVSDTFYNYTNTSEAKCERDVGYIIDAYLNDLRYGGNEELRNTIKYYWDQDVAQVDGDRGAEIAAHNFIKRLINDYIFTNTAFSALNTEVSQTIDLSKTSENTKYTPTNAVYTPSTGNMVLTISGHNLEVGDTIVIAPNSLTFTCALDGDATTHTYPRASGVPNTTGRDPFYKTGLIISAVTENTITVNVGISSDTSRHTFVSASANAVDASAAIVIDSFVFATVDVITNGLDNLPTVVPTGVGTIKIQGRYDLDELLLITNATKNEIIYNFSNPATGASVRLKTDKISIDPDYATYLQITDAITTINLNYDTSSHSSTDELQIFVEKIENGKSVVTTRPYDFGTDAIERMRIAPPLSMLDADFEYGLQPTKWAAIGTLRGYPSVYEVPGTDTSVLSVVTDASAGTSGVGQSLITVTTVAPHGFEPGTPITIKALEDSVVGAARAEGSFVIVTVPTQDTFTYYAKSKVGTTNGDVLSTTYTQLREAGFYTGADIGNSTFSIASNGSSGTMTTEIAVNTGEDIIPFDGNAPEIGAPITDASGSIPVGAQVTGVRATSAGGGTYITPEVVGDYNTGATSITVSDSTGIVQDLALDDGAGSAIYISSIVGNTLNLSNPIATAFKGNLTTYTNVSGSNEVGAGRDAEFNISRSAGIYTIDAIVAGGGSGYSVGDRILITGDNLGGLTPNHDLTIIVDTVISDGSINSASTEGSAFTGTETISGVTTPAAAGGAGSGAVFDVTLNNGSFDVTLAGFPNDDDSINYIVNDQIIITGDNFSGGFTPANDLIIKVNSIISSGAIDTFSVSGTAPAASDIFVDPAISSTTSVSGDGATFTVQMNGSNYNSVTVNTLGTNYLPTETITISGADLGGTTPTNDLTITIDNVNGSGGITDISISGLASGISPQGNKVGTNLIGSGLTLNVNVAGGVYSPAILNGGSNYAAGQEIIIPGSDLIGEDVINDLTITISTVDSNGSVTNITSSGTAPSGTGSYTFVAGVNDAPIGTGATFNIVRNNGTYSTITVNNAGSDYEVGNRIRITGNLLGGISPLNDLILRVDSITGSSINTVVENYTEAAFGVNLDLISTFTISEVTTQPLAFNSTLTFGALATIEVEFPNAHGLVPGDTFIVNVNTDDGLNNHNLANGSFFVTDIPAVNLLRYQARAVGSIDVSTNVVQGSIYPRPDSFFIHRPYDGGVQLGTGGPQHGAQAIRQSKKYIRYQSGKGIMYTTGALFAPSYDLRSLTAEDVEVGSLITVVTDDNDHGVQVGGIIRLLGVETPGYNSGPETAVPPQFDYEVVDVVDERTFKIRAQRRLGATSAVLGFGSQMSVVSWHGATVRSGIFDDQNGIFWEYDGTNISVNQRTGTRQLAGTISMTVDDNLITGTNTRFRDQLVAGDRIIIKGMTHVVSHVNSQTECTVTPDWRGIIDISGAKANLIVDKKVKQRDFNLDKLDGTGPSGYDIDIAKMQMIGIQYSWYGAGFIDFMLRGQDGNFIFCHRMRNSNVNTEAFMRSGNLPVRYEVSNEGPSGKLRSSMGGADNIIPLVDSSFFPDSGTVYIDNEIMIFTGNDTDNNNLTGVTRGATFTNFQAGATRSYTAGTVASHDARTGVVLISQTITPLISHWGSAFLTDGGFDEDRGYIFSYPESGLSVSTTKQTAFMIRLAPSVSNALIGDLGERELLNRAQLLLQELEVTSDGESGGTAITGGIVVEGVLNPKNYPNNPADVLWQTLSSEAQGGQPSFAQIAGGGGIKWSTGASATTATATAQAVITASNFEASETNTDSNFKITRASYNANGPILLGSATAGATVEYSSTVNKIDIKNNNVEIDTDSNTGSWSSGELINFTFGRNLVNSNFAYLDKASFEATGASLNTEVTGGSVTFPANTRISNIRLRNHGGTEFYQVTFNNAFSGTLVAGSGTIEFTFVEPPYAQPGETIFSFIAQPGERATVDFSELKELTNTPLGGRGTYPNGPDVLAINIYKVSGADTTANVILKWGEAQA